MTYRKFNQPLMGVQMFKTVLFALALTGAYSFAGNVVTDTTGAAVSATGEVLSAPGRALTATGEAISDSDDYAAVESPAMDGCWSIHSDYASALANCRSRVVTRVWGWWGEGEGFACVCANPEGGTHPDNGFGGFSRGGFSRGGPNGRF